VLLARHGRLRRRNRKRRSILLFGALLLASLIALLLATVAFTGQQILLSQCNLGDLHRLTLSQNSFLYTDNGTKLGVVPSATNRQRLPLSQISPSLPQATVAIEDARFWQHGALDYQGILRAFYQDLSKGHIVQGGSTITQELVRNLYIGTTKQRTLSRKIKEACLATKVFDAVLEFCGGLTSLRRLPHGFRQLGIDHGAFCQAASFRIILPIHGLLRGGQLFSSRIQLQAGIFRRFTLVGLFHCQLRL